MNIGAVIVVLVKSDPLERHRSRRRWAYPTALHGTGETSRTQEPEEHPQSNEHAGNRLLHSMPIYETVISLCDGCTYRGQ